MSHAPHTMWSFWKDEAKLSILSPAWRLQYYIAVIGSLASVSLAGVTVYKLFSLFSSDPALMWTIVGALLVPFSVATGLFTTGGAAGAKLMGELADKKQQVDSQPLSMVEAKRWLIWSKSRLQRKADELRQQQPPQECDLSHELKVANEIYDGLFGEKLEWCQVRFSAHDAAQDAAVDHLGSAVYEHDRAITETLKQGGFDARWKPPAWLKELRESENVPLPPEIA